MAKYTTTIKTFCESLNNEINDSGIPSGYNSISQLIENARPYIFDFTYPLWSDNHAEQFPDYKKHFETKIMKRYYVREIGQETFAQFKLQLDNKLNEIMPYYNQLFESQLLDFPVFENINMTTNNQRADVGNEQSDRLGHSQTVDDSKTTGSHSDSFNTTRTPNLTHDQTTKHLDTPQGTISNLTDNGYLTDAVKDVQHETGSETTNGTSSGTTSSDYDNTTTTDSTDNFKKDNTFNSSENNTSHGKNSGETYSEMLNKYRGTFLNIEKDILDELNELFMLIY